MRGNRERERGSVSKKSNLRESCDNMFVRQREGGGRVRERGGNCGYLLVEIIDRALNESASNSKVWDRSKKKAFATSGGR